MHECVCECVSMFTKTRQCHFPPVVCGFWRLKCPNSKPREGPTSPGVTSDPALRAPPSVQRHLSALLHDRSPCLRAITVSSCELHFSFASVCLHLNSHSWTAQPLGCFTLSSCTAILSPFTWTRRSGAFSHFTWGWENTRLIHLICLTILLGPFLQCCCSKEGSEKKRQRNRNGLRWSVEGMVRVCRVADAWGEHVSAVETVLACVINPPTCLYGGGWVVWKRVCLELLERSQNVETPHR